VGWLIWDKKQSGNFTSGHAEMAWTTLDQPIRAFRMSQVEAYCGLDKKVHPTQKPLALMVWCLSFLPDSQIILDPFMGSGTTGVACVRTGRRFIGVERESRYFDIACRRIEQAMGDQALFAEARPETAKEERLFQEASQ
jgi:DNA modification methylase